MMKILLSFLLLGLILQTPALAAEKGSNTEIEVPKVDGETSASVFPKFIYEYQAVDRNLKGNKGLSKELARLMAKNPEQGEFISTFWRVQALKHCREFTQDTIEKAVRSKDSSVMSEFMEHPAHCHYGYYLEHWDAINESIRAAIKARKRV